jgi:uncharacterized protein YndB with AHSA1/START domain
MTTSTFGLLRSDGSGRAVRFERRYETDIDDLWAACTDPERLPRWLAHVSGDFRLGGQLFVDYGDGEHNELVVRRCDPPRVLEVDWAYGEEFTSVVVVELTPADDATILVLDHRGLPAGTATGYSAGWHAFLDRLADDVAGSEPVGWQERFDALIKDYRPPS